MNRGVFHSSLVQQMMSSGGVSNNNMRPPLDHQQTFPLPSSPMFFQYPQASNNVHPLMNNLCLDSPESWTQIFMGGGLVGDEEKYMSTAPNFQTKNMMENWQDQVMYSSEALHNYMADVKHGYSGAGFIEENEKIQQVQSSNKCLWNQVFPANSSSPTSCLNTSFSSNNMMDFSNNNHKERGHQENSSECNSTATGAPFKKARTQVSSSPQLSTFKVRKEKMGDRITALHQLISPFGKTDTASVLLEAIGYIRFLHGQIEALSSPYLGTRSGNNLQHSVQRDQMACLFPEEPGQLLNESGMKKRRHHEDQEEGNNDVKKDLKSRGLCLVPVAFTLHVGSENGADFWAPMAFGGGF